MMKQLIRFASAIGLLLIIVPASLYLGDAIGKEQMQSLMLLGTIVWFGSAALSNRAERSQ